MFSDVFDYWSTKSEVIYKNVILFCNYDCDAYFSQNIKSLINYIK